MLSRVDEAEGCYVDGGELGKTEVQEVEHEVGEFSVEVVVERLPWKRCWND
jgi:hypothetical protein